MKAAGVLDVITSLVEMARNTAGTHSADWLILCILHKQGCKLHPSQDREEIGGTLNAVRKQLVEDVIVLTMDMRARGGESG